MTMVSEISTRAPHSPLSDQSLCNFSEVVLTVFEQLAAFSLFSEIDLVCLPSLRRLRACNSFNLHT